MYIIPMKSEIIVFDHQLSLDNPFRVQRLFCKASREPVIPDMHYALHIGILKCGKLTSCIGASARDILPGQLWFIGAWEPHYAVEIQEDAEIVLCTILMEGLGIATPFYNINWHLPFIVPPESRPQAEDPESMETVLNIAKEILRSLDSGLDENQRKCVQWLKIHELLLFIISNSGLNRGKNADGGEIFMRIMPAIALIRTGNHQLLSLGDAAKACGLGKSRFCSLFKKATGLSFARFAMSSRLSGALSDVRNTDLPFKTIAEKWDFFD
ncbi:MAG: hypothetical protein WCP55_15460, partial [Lentisphaerota bacterium]